MNDDQVSETLKHSRELQEKFELYLLALVFTLLGLAVQTAKFDGGWIASCFELAGWAALLLSGIVGVLRLEWKPVVYGHLANKELQERDAAAIRKSLREGVLIISEETSAPLDPIALLGRKTNSASRYEGRVKELERSLQRRYKLHKWAFVFGILSLACSRGYVAAINAATAIRVLFA